MKTKFVNFVLVGCCLWISAKAQGQTQLKFWLNSSLGAHEKAAYQKAGDEYSQKNPVVKITVEAVAGSDMDAAKLMTAVRSGVGPDLAVMDRFAIAQRKRDAIPH